MASDLATLAEIRAHVETDLTDDALTKLVDAADAEIRRFAGPHDGERTVKLNGGFQDILLPTPAASIDSISEDTYFGDSSETVDESDYTTLYGGRVLRKNGIWNSEVTVIFTPVSTNDYRTEALLKMVALAVDFETVESRSDGSYSQKSRDYWKERNRALNSIPYRYGGPS